MYGLPTRCAKSPAIAYGVVAVQAERGQQKIQSGFQQISKED